MSPPCIITKFYEKGSLFNLLKERELTLVEKFKIIKGIAAGMEHLHMEKIIHRDLAARNILLSSQMEAVVSDFGFARVIQNSQSDGSTTLSTVGPVKWMAPECFEKRIYSIKTDIWAWGVTVWEIFAREIPFSELDNMQTAIAVLKGERLKVPSNCPMSLEKLLYKCWLENPDDRPNFTEILSELNKIENDFFEM